MVNVDLATLRMVNTVRSLINNIPLDEIAWWENGHIIDIDKRNVEEFMDTGLANMDFINSGFFRRD